MGQYVGKGPRALWVLPTLHSGCISFHPPFWMKTYEDKLPLAGKCFPLPGRVWKPHERHYIRCMLAGVCHPAPGQYK